MNEMDKIVAGESEAIDSKLRRAGIPARIVSSDDTFRFHCTQCGKRCTDEAMVMVWELMSLLLYFRYDTSEPFDKQFDKNTGSLMTFLSRLTDSETEGEA